MQILILNRIKQFRVEKGYTQMQLAKILNVSNGQIGNMESYSQPQKYTLGHIKTICDKFGGSVSELFTQKKNCSCDELVEAILEYEKK